MGIALNSINPSLLEILAQTRPTEKIILTSDPLYAFKHPTHRVYDAQWCSDAAPTKPRQELYAEIIDVEDLSGRRLLTDGSYLC